MMVKCSKFNKCA